MEEEQGDRREQKEWPKEQEETFEKQETIKEVKREGMDERGMAMVAEKTEEVFYETTYRDILTEIFNNDAKQEIKHSERELKNEARKSASTNMIGSKITLQTKVINKSLAMNNK